jgi:hypothetical protein
LAKPVSEKQKAEISKEWGTILISPDKAAEKMDLIY